MIFKLAHNDDLADYMQRTNKFSEANDDFEFVEGWGQLATNDFGKHYNLTPGTYILVVETQVYDDLAVTTTNEAFSK